MKVVSLLPSTTEIICRLGYQDLLAGRSHECDIPKSVKKLPAITKPGFKSDVSSSEINRQITHLIRNGLSVYRVDDEKLNQLKPDIILTQDQCEACAASFSDVKEAVSQKVDKDIKIVSVSPANLQKVCESFGQIGAAVGDYFSGVNLADYVLKKLDSLKSVIKVDDNYPTIACIEWLEPLMGAGNWIPELASYSRCSTLLGNAGEHSPVITWETVIEANPDIIILFPCGYSIRQTLDEMELLTGKDEWQTLKAVQNEQVYIADGNHYFNRPGPRLLDSAYILAEIAHPEHLDSRFQGNGWINYFHH